MSREHYAWGSLRRTRRQLGLLVVLGGIGFVGLVLLLLIFGAPE